MSVKREGFQLKKFKKTNAGIQADYLEETVLAKDVISKQNVTRSLKDDPHPDLINAMKKLDEIVRYDEDYGDDEEIEVTGITIFPSNETAIITHLKKIKSGRTARNSGRIHFNSEEFEKASDLVDIIDDLETEVYKFFFKGKRAQLQMFPHDEEEEKAA